MRFTRDGNAHPEGPLALEELRGGSLVRAYRQIVDDARPATAEDTVSDKKTKSVRRAPAGTARPVLTSAAMRAAIARALKVEKFTKPAPAKPKSAGNKPSADKPRNA